jgi:hypothetical protein
VLTVLDTTLVDSFDEALNDRIGVIVPRDTLVYSRATNAQAASFSGAIVAASLSTVSIPVTPYHFDQQEGKIPNRGMILALANEGTRIRHYEFYGAAGPPERRPFIRIVYGFPAPFEKGRP